MSSNGQGARRRRAIVGSTIPLFADALAGVIASHGFEVAARMGDAGRMRDAVLIQPPHLAVIDFNDSQPSGIDMLRDIRSAGGAMHVILIAEDSDVATPVDALELGVDGLLPRSATAATVAQCVAAVAAGDQWLDPRMMKAAYDRMAQRQTVQPSLLTPRERDVARLVATGKRNRVIAEQLGISEGTVKMHLHNVYAKMGLESRTQLAMDIRISEVA